MPHSQRFGRYQKMEGANLHEVYLYSRTCRVRREGRQTVITTWIYPEAIPDPAVALTEKLGELAWCRVSAPRQSSL